MASHRYRDVDSSLPDVGKSALGPKQLKLSGVEAIMASTNLLALGLLLGYVRSYAATAGAVMWGLPVGIIALILGWQTVAIVAFAVTGMSAWVVMECRRTARKWEAVVSTRIAQLTGSPL